ncbi:MAG: hypothetical protein ACYSR0_07675 [Planctomycetota bacterium]|jgi:hypothetical protein
MNGLSSTKNDNDDNLYERDKPIVMVVDDPDVVDACLSVFTEKRFEFK